MNTIGHATGVRPQFEPLLAQSGIHVRDPIEDAQAVLYTHHDVEPTPTDTDGFRYPVDSAVELTVTRLRTPILLTIVVRDADGTVRSEFDPNGAAEGFSAGEYLLELGNMPMKMYVHVPDAGFHLVPGDGEVDLLFDSNTTIRLGARSYHSQPARTLTTTREPADLMDAISLFGNAMKTWSPERTFPTLRGHPPLVELAPEPAIPEDLSPPDTGVRITVPADHSWVYPIVPLAYWFGATVEPGDPAIHLDGRTYALGTAGGYTAATEREAFEHHVRDLLQYSFLFDCTCRRFYDIETVDARRVKAADLGIEFESLASAPIAERVRRYLEVDGGFETLETRLDRPDWRLTTDVQPSPDRSTVTPFLARDLSVVRCPPSRVLDAASGTATAENVFTRGGSDGTGSLASRHGGSTTVGTDGVLTRSSSSPSSVPGSGARDRVLSLPEAASNLHGWVGDGFAVGAAKATTTSYLQRLEKFVDGDSRTTVEVIVNDTEMGDEASVSEIYGTREHLPFDITVHDALSGKELAGVFEKETDFVHYVGHVDEDGFECTDGYLNADQLGTVGADTFVLNACASYEQGQRLVDRGAIAGVVTLEEVISSVATKIGTEIARLLNFGLSIGTATDLIQDSMVLGGQYAVVGDSNTTLAQPTNGVATVHNVDLRPDGWFDVEVETFATWNCDIGSLYTPYIEGCDDYTVVPGTIGACVVDEETLQAAFDRSVFPILAKDEFYWSDQVSAAELKDRLQAYE